MAPEQAQHSARVSVLQVPVLESAETEAREGQEEEEMNTKRACSYCGGELSETLPIVVTDIGHDAKVGCSACAALISEATLLIHRAFDKAVTDKRGGDPREHVKNCVSAAMRSFEYTQKADSQ